MVLYKSVMYGSAGMTSSKTVSATVKSPVNSKQNIGTSKAKRVLYVSTQPGPHYVREETVVSSEPDPNLVSDQVKAKRQWPCPDCSKVLSSKRSYNEHRNIHTDSRPFACDFCEYAAASQMTLRRHKLRNHTARHEWGYRCPYCEEIYMEPASYQQHVQTKHINQSATYGCPHSDCNFTTKCFRHFQEHLMKHINADTTMNGVTKISMSKQNLSRYLIDDEYGIGYRPNRTIVLKRNPESLSPPSNPSGSNSHIPESSVNPQFINLRSSYNNPEQSNPQVIRARLVPRHDIKIEPNRGQGNYEYFQSGQDSDKSEENFYDLESYSEAPPILEQEASFTEIIDNCLQTEVKTITTNRSKNQFSNGMEDVELD